MISNSNSKTNIPKRRRPTTMESFSPSCGGSISGSSYQRANDHGVLLSHGLRSYVGSASFSLSTLVLDSERGELVEAPAKLERKAVAAERNVEALKNHSEAERRRRARINVHFDTLRSLIPGATKMDKASVLAEVISHLKDLKRKAKEARELHSVIPKDTDEVKVEQEDGHFSEGRPNIYSMRVSLSCDYRPGLLSDLRRALDALNLILTRAEISTLGCRMKNVFVMKAQGETDLAEDDEMLRHFHARSICQTIRSVIDNVSSSDEFLRSSLSNKRRRVCMLDP